MAEKSKGKRVTIDLTSSAVEELDRIKQLTELTTADLFRNAFSLLRIFVDERCDGNKLAIVNDHDKITTKIELPIVVPLNDKSKTKPKKVKG